MASEIRVDKINSLSGVGTVTLSPTGVDIAGITTAATLRATTGIVTSLTAGSLTSLGAVSGTTGTFTGNVDIAANVRHIDDTDTYISFSADNQIEMYVANQQAIKFTTTSIETGDNKRIDIIDAAGDRSGEIKNSDSSANSLMISADPDGSGSSSVMQFAVDGSERARIDSSGRLLINKTASTGAGYGTQNKLQIEGTDADTSSIQIKRNSNDSNGPYLYLGKSRGSSVDSDTVVQDGDEVGSVVYHGTDGTDANSVCAKIVGAIDGTPGSNDLPGRLMFMTTADGSSDATERVRIDSSGNFLVGGTSLGAAGSFGMEQDGHVRSVLASGDTGDTLFGAISGVSNGFQVNISGTNVQKYKFHNGSTQTLLIDSDGLKFMNDTAAANALDDYEEGTWTPSTTEGMNNVYGAHYVKVGAKVSVQAYITLPTSSSGSNIRIDSFPFTSKGSNHYAIGTGYSQWSGSDHMFIQLAPSATHAYIYKNIGNSVTFSDGSGGYFLFSMTYFTA